MKTLYEALNYTKKNSILKSVAITNNYCGGFRIIEVEPCNQTGANALDESIQKYDKTLDYVEKELKKLFKGETVRVCVYSNVRDPFEYILDTKTGKTF